MDLIFQKFSAIMLKFVLIVHSSLWLTVQLFLLFLLQLMDELGLILADVSNEELTDEKKEQYNSVRCNFGQFPWCVIFSTCLFNQKQSTMRNPESSKAKSN